MPLGPGTRLGPYEIQSAIGAGGMGEVYRARDTRLKRDVALKILPESFATDPDRLARFQREAEVLASLNHPSIAGIYGLEESDGTRALVMELVEGETLADRIARGPIRLDEALPIAKQIAEALEAAHEQGIIHRDLKPANIKVRDDGTVKVLDFGLAKLAESSASATGSSPLSLSPTITSPAITGVGVLLGTAAYMSPEQAKGRAADKRSDIWAFACVLYEMLSGRRLFPQGDISETIVSILRDTPDWRALPLDTPPRIRALLERCLRKDARHRLQSIGDARVELEDAQSDPSVSAVSGGETRVRGRYAWPAFALISLIAAAVLAARLLVVPTPARVVFQVTAPDNARIDIGVPLSPDGRTVAFLAVSEGGQPQIWIRPLDSSSARPLAGTEQAQRPFWSPDSQYIAFFAQGKLQKVALAGGPPIVICNEPGRDGAWGVGDVILIGGQRGKPLLRVSAAGGQAVPLTELGPNEADHEYPEFLPDGQHFLFMARAASAPGDGTENGVVYVTSLDSKDRRPLPRIGAGVRYSPTGHILFVRDGTLMAQAFDVDGEALSGAPFPVAADVPGPVAPFSVSANGTLAYLSGGIATNSELAWFDRSGKQLEVVGTKGQYATPALSPDGKYVAFSRGAPPDIWLLDIAKNLTSRLTSDPAADFFPVWSPDGRRIAFASTRGGTANLYERTVGIVGAEKVLLKSDLRPTNSQDWSLDGQVLVYTARNDVWALPLSNNGTPLRVTQTPFGEQNPQFSPDGRWIAYSSDETGDDQIYMQSFPDGHARQQVSTTGGIQPRWSRNGKELFYMRPDFTLMAVSLKTLGAATETSAPAPLFRAPLALAGPPVLTRSYSVSGDGRFLMNVAPGDASRPVTVVLNWAASLKK